MVSAIEGLEPEVGRRLAVRRSVHTVTTVALVGLIALAVVDGLGWWDAYGVDTGRVSGSGGGYELDVRYGTVTRPALATPFEIAVTRAGGFDGPITVAVDRDYLEMWDVNGILPAPSGETSHGPWVLWEFDPPTGDTLNVSYDARIEPAVQNGRPGSVAVLDGGELVVTVEFDTRVLP